MEFFYLLAGSGALLILIFFVSMIKSLREYLKPPYIAKQRLFTPSQRAFLGVLERVLGDSYRVYGRIRVADLIGIDPRASQRARQRADFYIGEQSFDFVICTAQSTVICAINLAASARSRIPFMRDRIERICTAAGLPFIQIRRREKYSIAEIEKQLQTALQARRGNENSLNLDKDANARPDAAKIRVTRSNNASLNLGRDPDQILNSTNDSRIDPVISDRESSKN